MDVILMIIKIVGILIGGLAALQELTKDKQEGKQPSRQAILLLVLGLGSAVAAEMVDITIKRKTDQQMLERNSELLSQVQRTLHPLFPLTLHVTFSTPLTEPHAQPLRHLLETRLAEEKRRAAAEGDGVDLLSIGIRKGATYPSRTRDPYGYGLVACRSEIVTTNPAGWI